VNGFEVIVRFVERAAAGLGGALAGPHLAGIGLWLFGLVFFWAGASKLRRPELIAMTLVDLGVARGIRPALGLALGGLEVALAAWLVSGVAPAAATAAAGAALALFAAAILAALVAGKRVACMCFGDHSATMSGWTLARTAALAGAGFWLALAGGAPVARLSRTSILEAVTAVALVSLAVVVSRLPRLVRWNPIPSFESEVET